MTEELETETQMSALTENDRLADLADELAQLIRDMPLLVGNRAGAQHRLSVAIFDLGAAQKRLSEIKKALHITKTRKPKPEVKKKGRKLGSKNKRTSADQSQAQIRDQKGQNPEQNTVDPSPDEVLDEMDRLVHEAAQEAMGNSRAELLAQATCLIPGCGKLIKSDDPDLECTCGADIPDRKVKDELQTT